MTENDRGSVEFRIKNLLPYKRSIVTPSDASILIDPMSTVSFRYPKGYESFFKKLEIYGFKVTIKDDQTVNPVVFESEESTKDKTTVEEVTEEVDDQSNTTNLKEESNDEDITADEVRSKLGDLNPEQLKNICDKLGIYTSANKVSNLVNRILNNNTLDEDLIKAYKEVI